MTDRFIAYTVLLDREIREDDAEAITNAIGMVKGVAKVTPVVADANSAWALHTARQELGQKLWEMLYPKKGG